MTIREYIVRHPAGILWNGKIVPAGETVAAADGGAMKAYLHFKQVVLAPSANPENAPAADAAPSR